MMHSTLPAVPSDAPGSGIPTPLDETCDLSGIRIPHIKIDVFRETDAFAATWERAAQDRRMVSATTTIYPDGFLGAIRKYTVEQTPNLIIVETDSTEDILEYQTDSLAEVCDPGTELIVVGHRNDIALYQKLLAMGVSNYMVYPVTIGSIIAAINEVYREPERTKIGRIHAVVGSKGGVGSSTIAQNLAHEMAEETRSEVLLIDMDLCFGTASLNFDVEANQGLRELIDQSDRVDSAMLDRVLVRHGSHLSLLGALPALVNDRDPDANNIEKILNVAAAHVPNVVLDLPHTWNAWIQRTLTAADRVVVVSTPDLCALRNAATMVNELKGIRPNDSPPMLVLNQTGLPGRSEIAAREINRLLEISPVAELPFDAKAIGRTMSSGKMLRDVGPRRPIARRIRGIAELLSKRTIHQKLKKKRGLFA